MRPLDVDALAGIKIISSMLIYTCIDLGVCVWASNMDKILNKFKVKYQNSILIMNL